MFVCLKDAEGNWREPESFDLESNVPTVHCLGAYTKNGQEAAIPLRADLAARGA